MPISVTSHTQGHSFAGCYRVVLLLFALWSGAAAAAPAEEQIKAAFILNFTGYIEWPATTKPHRTIVVAGSPQLRQWLERGSQDRQFAGKSLQIRALEPNDSLADADVLYLSETYPQSAAVLAQLQHKPVLTIGGAESFVRAGGMIRLFNDNNRLRFDVNRSVLEQHGLKVSARLLQLARRVEG